MCKYLGRVSDVFGKPESGLVWGRSCDTFLKMASLAYLYTFWRMEFQVLDVLNISAFDLYD